METELVGIIGGTGLGDSLAEQLADVEFRDVDTPFGRPSAALMVGTLGGRRVAFINRHGPGHRFSPSEVPFAANVFALKEVGVHAIIASGAVGALQAEVVPGDLVIVDQFIDKTCKRTNSFFTGLAAVHCEMTEPVCPRLCRLLTRTGEDFDIKIRSHGTYVCMEGPQFSTRAESLMHRAWGGDLVGMTAMPEAKLAREAQICYALVALVSDYDCWRSGDSSKGKHSLLKEIIANLQTATNNCLNLIKAALADKHELVCDDCICRKSLDLAVWTDRSKIDPARKQTLKVLFE